MSERERWIVYPLIFLALGSAIRDKVLRAVVTDDLQCKRIRCEQIVADDIVGDNVVCDSVSVVDPQVPNKFLAQLGIAEIAGADGNQHRVGRLVLTDDEGKRLFGLADDFLLMRNLRCESVTVTDPDNPRVILAQLGSAQVRSSATDPSPRRVGVLALNNQSVVNVLGIPPSAPTTPIIPSPAPQPGAAGEEANDQGGSAKENAPTGAGE